MIPLPRVADPDDLPAVHALLSAAGLSTTGLEDTWRIWVAGPDAQVLAAVALERYPAPDLPGHAVCLLRSLVVDASARGRGWGAALVRTALATADAAVTQTPPAAGADGSGPAHPDERAVVALLTETAAGYFDRFGFRPVGRADLPAELGASTQLRGVCCASARVYLRG
ncbi:MAG TPA: GNAT family N-acetyltransferase [Kineosporiaceae bacterium]|nr:GNAT family N-acetyltransferase [Kineosporiaceae bacterium]